MKNDRQSRILSIIAANEIETQEQLMQALEQEGYRVTQATISRDIKQLRIVKKLGSSGVVRYEVSQPGDTPESSAKLDKIFRECVTHYDCAQNLVIIKTMPGLASAACSAIDRMDMPMFVGSIAGDDTAFIAMRDSASATAFCEQIHEQLK